MNEISDDQIKQYKIRNCLETYKAKWLNQHLKNQLIVEDMEDLHQDLAVLMLELQRNPRCLAAENIENYCYRSYKNLALKFRTKYFKRVNVMKNIDPKILCDVIAASVITLDDFRDGNLDRPYFWELECLQGLTELEQKVITLKYISGYSNAEVTRLIDYKGSVAGLWQICCRVRKKLSKEYGFSG